MRYQRPLTTAFSFNPRSRVRSDSQSRSPEIIKMVFQSTLPREERLVAGVPRPASSSFNPRSRVRSDFRRPHEFMD